MNNDRLWVIGSLALTGVILAMSWFLGISPVLAQVAIADKARADVQATNAVHAATLASLKERFNELGALESELKQSRESLPEHADLADFIGELDALQLAHGVGVTKVAVSDSVPFVPELPVVEVPEAPADGSEAAPEPAADTAPTGAALVSEENFIAIPIALSAVGGYDQVMDFVAGLQTGNRLYLVTNLVIAADPDGPTFNAEISGYVYVLRDPTIPAPLDELGEAESTETVN